MRGCTRTVPSVLFNRAASLRQAVRDEGKTPPSFLLTLGLAASRPAASADPPVASVLLAIGRVRFNGVDVTAWMPHQREQVGIRFFSQDASVYGKMTVEDALLAESLSLELNVKRRRSQLDELLFQFGLNSKSKELVGSLSSGERTRLEIARCLVGKPSLLVLDEPFEATDVVTTHGIEDILSDASQKGLSILLTDCRGREILPIVHRTFVLRDGVVVVSGDAETILSNLDARRDYFGDDGLPRRY